MIRFIIDYFKEKIEELKKRIKKNPYIYKYIFFWLFFIILITIIFYYINLYKKELHYHNIVKEAYSSKKLNNKDNLIYIPPEELKMPLTRNINKRLANNLSKKEDVYIPHIYKKNKYKIKNTLDDVLKGKENIKDIDINTSNLKTNNVEINNIKNNDKISYEKNIKEVIKPMLEPVINEIRSLKNLNTHKPPEIERYSVSLNDIHMNQPMNQMPMNQPMNQIPMNQPINIRTNQMPMNQPMNQIPMNQPMNLRMNQPMNQPMNQQLNHNNPMIEVRLDNLLDVVNANPPNVHVDDTQFHYDL
jgi:hypothetical protein